jgi:hypothetical protein
MVRIMGNSVHTMFVQWPPKVCTILYEPHIVRTMHYTNYTNIYELFPKILLHSVLTRRKTFDELKDIIMDDSVKLNVNCWCYRCQKMCVRGPRENHGCELDLGIMGSPCTESHQQSITSSTKRVLKML